MWLSHCCARVVAGVMILIDSCGSNEGKGMVLNTTKYEVEWMR